MNNRGPEISPDSAGGVRGILTIGLLFFIFGFVTWLNGPLITFVKLAFTLDDVNAFLVPMAFYLSYFFLALPASAILRRTGMKQGMALGLYIMAAGSVLFGQFTTMRDYPGALAGLFITGAGLSLLQTASNPYVCIIGPHESAARRIAVMGICHKFAGVIAPFIFAALVLKDVETFDTDVAMAPTHEAREALLDAFAARVHAPYLLMALMLALLGVWIARSKLPDVRPEPAVNSGEMRSVFAVPHLWLGVVCLFLYVGVEVMAGDAIGLYGAGFGLPISATRLFTSYTLFAMLIGYVAGLLVIPRFISQQSYLAVFGGLPAKADLAPVSQTAPVKGGSQKIVEMGVPQSVAVFGLGAMPRKDPDFITAFVVNHILGGGGFSAKLMEEVREKRGLAYSVYTYLQPYQHASILVGSVATKNASMAESLKIIRSEMKKMADNGPTAEDLQAAKDYLTGSYALRFDTNSKIASQLLGLMQEGFGPDYVENRNAMINAVTLADAKRVAARFLQPDNLVVTIVGKPVGMNSAATPPVLQPAVAAPSRG